MNRPDLCGKTGTTNESRDTWFSGFNANIATTVWVGHDNFAKTLGRGEAGAKTALPIWIEFMSFMLKDQPLAPVQKPDYVVLNRMLGYPEYMISNADDINLGGDMSSDSQMFIQENTDGTETKPYTPSQPVKKPETIEDLF